MVISSDAVAYNFTFLGVTVAFTSSGVISIIGMIIGIIGLIMGFQRNAEMRRSNDLKERELNAKAKDSETKAKSKANRESETEKQTKKQILNNNDHEAEQ